MSEPDDFADEAPDSEELDVTATAIAMAVRGADPDGIDVHALSQRLDMPNDRRFRLLLWQQMERYRDETGRHLRIVAGRVVACTEQQQIHEASKRWRTAAARARRAFELIEPVLGSADAEARAKAERQVSRQVTEQAAIDATAAAHERETALTSTIRAALAPKKDKSQ